MDKEAIRDELKKVRQTIKDLKKEFSVKKKEKEEHFEKGEGYSKQINELYEEIKVIEVDNNLKAINTDLEERKTALAELKSGLTEVEKTFGDVKQSSRQDKPAIRTISVDKAKKELKQLDTKLQTQVLSLDKESELIKKVQELKEQISLNTGNTSDDNDEFRTAKKKLNSVRRKFNNTEKKIRSLYKQIRLISKEKKKRYKQIDALRDTKKKAFEDFRTTKKDYSIKGKDLKDLFKKENDLLEQLGEAPIKRRQSHTRHFPRVNRKEVEDKLMKKGGTLTTEDLMMFQKH